MIEQTISQYDSIEKLSGGRMGAVYEAHYLKLNRLESTQESFSPEISN